VWANETTVYLSPSPICLGGGYALWAAGPRAIDLIKGCCPGSRLIADVLSFFFSPLVGAWLVGSQMAWGSFLQSEGRARPGPADLAGEDGLP